MSRKRREKKEDASGFEIVQTLWVDSLTLALDRNACISCDLCRLVCPKEAIEMAAVEGRVVPDLDEDLCSMCGLCASFCPVNAIRITARNTWKETEDDVRPVLDVGGIPHFSKGMKLDTSLCPPGCILCVEACPREALKRGAQGIELDRDKCLSCAHCVAACPVEGAITVTRLFDGQVMVDVGKCPPDCDYCVTACPTQCYTAVEPKGVEVDSRHCICCGACLVACPHGALDLTRLRLRSLGDGYSAVWSRAVDNLLSENERFISQNEGAFAKLTELLKDSRL